MELYLWRHGDAEDLSETGSDNDRKLTEEGKEKVAAVAKALVDMEYDAPKLVLSSPLMRAQETAAIIRQVFAPESSYGVSPQLEPSSDVTHIMSVLNQLAQQFDSIMLVGHEPHLSTFGGALLTGTLRPVIEVKKSSVALFELTHLEPPRMHGYLKFLLPSRIGKA